MRKGPDAVASGPFILGRGCDSSTFAASGKVGKLLSAVWTTAVSPAAKPSNVATTVVLLSQDAVFLLTTHSDKEKDPAQKREVFFLVGEGGFEPPKAKPADLQSVPFGHSGTLPNPTTTNIPQGFPIVKRNFTVFKSFLQEKSFCFVNFS